jgi:serine/threonine protein kinase
MTTPQTLDTGLVGTVLDDAYFLNRLIFEGGMGTVYEAVHMRLRKRVAVKVMVSELAANPEGLARFRREVEVTSQLSHPHVIQLLDFGTTPAGQPYLVMEYLDGEDLEHRLGRVGRLSLAAAVDIVRQVASALAVIHAKGIVHRDLKPANVFLLPLEGSPDFVKVVDFGISKVKSAQTKLTRAYTMVGTPECMSPEQATARVDDVDHRSDQWAMGCVAWRMITGALPFSGRTLNELLQQIVHDDPRPMAELAPEVPAEVEAVLRRALAKKQDDRFPTITAFARALEAAALTAPAAQPTPAPVAPPRPVATPARRTRSGAATIEDSLPRRSAPTWILAVVTVVSMAVGGTLFYRANAPAVQRLLHDLLPGSGTQAPD